MRNHWWTFHVSLTREGRAQEIPGWNFPVMNFRRLALNRVLEEKKRVPEVQSCWWFKIFLAAKILQLFAVLLPSLCRRSHLFGCAVRRWCHDVNLESALLCILNKLRLRPGPFNRPRPLNSPKQFFCFLWIQPYVRVEIRIFDFLIDNIYL